ncbi:transposase [Myxococcus xanthus]|uniref:IS630 family transposase n=1 Tax=Myxococcus xanthus TaxID=34 RepID=UPI0011268EDE|nr:IS630 family transposase [Myxococcus xanthus]QDE91465.1 transposase [Myxococcus xanthus]
MAWQPRRLTAEQLEERRLEAAQLLESGRYTQAEVARQLGVSPSSVCEWARCLKEEGLSALNSRTRAGRPSKLTDEQWQDVKRLMEEGAKAAGFATERWTLKRVAQLIHRHFAVHYHPNYLAEPLHRLGLSVQRPRPKARERDDALVEAWLKRDWPRIKRGLLAEGQPLPAWTRRVVRFGPAWVPPGPR